MALFGGTLIHLLCLLRLNLIYVLIAPFLGRLRNSYFINSYFIKAYSY